MPSHTRGRGRTIPSLAQVSNNRKMMLQDDTLMSLEQLLLSPDIDKKIRILSLQIMDRDAFQIGDFCEHRSISARSIEAKMCE